MARIQGARPAAVPDREIASRTYLFGSTTHQAKELLFPSNGPHEYTPAYGEPGGGTKVTMYSPAGKVGSVKRPSADVVVLPFTAPARTTASSVDGSFS